MDMDISFYFLQVLDASHAGCGGEAPASCAVCCEQMRAGELVKCLPCAHRYHVSCIDQWLQQKAVCPICQCSIKQDGL